MAVMPDIKIKVTTTDLERSLIRCERRLAVIRGGVERETAITQVAEEMLNLTGPAQERTVHEWAQQLLGVRPGA